MYEIKTEQYSGPLELLLKLIEEQKLNISQISLAKVTDQYLTYLDKLKEINASDLADFLVIATKLLIIKSKSVIPANVEDEEDSADQLEMQLKMYKQYLLATKKIESILKEKNFVFTRERIVLNFEPAFSPPENCEASDLRNAFENILNRIDYIVRLPQKIMEKTVSLNDVVESMRNNLKSAEKIIFRSLISQAKSKGEVVVYFMALLQLIKNGEALVNQDTIFDEIIVQKF